MPILAAKNLTLFRGRKLICQNLNWKLYSGEMWAIIGSNGSGKSTLLQTLAGLYPTNAGEIHLRHRSLSELPRLTIAKHLGLLLQHHEEILADTVLNVALTGRHPHAKFWQPNSLLDIETAEQALQQMELSELRHKKVNHLSGGERQRLGIATLLTQTADIYLLDEPTNHLDIRQQHRVLSFFQQLTRSDSLVIMATHDINLVARYCDRVVMLLDNGLVLLGDVKELLIAENLQRLFQCEFSRVGDFWQASVS